MVTQHNEEVNVSCAARLACQEPFWEQWGFIPWQQPPFEGVVRSQHFLKAGILGPLAEYRAWETIVWSCGSAEDRDALWESLVYKPDVLTQRFLFLLENTEPESRIRSFWFGMRGYAEFFSWNPGSEGAHKKISDLAGLVELALALEFP